MTPGNDGNGYRRGEDEDRLSIFLFGRKLVSLTFHDGDTEEGNAMWIDYVVDLLNENRDI